MEKQYPGYSEERVERITAGVWHGYPEATKKRIVGRIELSACISGGAKQIFDRIFRDKLKEVDEKSREGKFLKSLLSDLDFMPVCAVGGKHPRKISKWQMCIKEGMTGKKWDPSRIKELSKKYKAGLCPSK